MAGLANAAVNYIIIIPSGCSYRHMPDCLSQKGQDSSHTIWSVSGSIRLDSIDVGFRNHKDLPPVGNTGMNKTLTIGLTGGIGSGKSTVCSLFKKLGTPVIDADQIAHYLVSKEQPTLQKIVRIFGPGVLTDEGHLDRIHLREMIFSDPDARKKLEDILHPLVYAEIDNQVKKITSPYVVVCIPLLIETNATDRVDRVLVVDATEDQQLQRASERNNMNKEMINKIIQSQITRKKRLDAADEIINNTGNLHDLERQIEKLHQYYSEIAADSIYKTSHIT